MNNIDWVESYNKSLSQIEEEYSLTELLTQYKEHDPNSYWGRIAKLSAFRKDRDENKYHFLFEIEVLSSQIHFGLKNCLFFDSLKSKKRESPNIYNHRYTFFVESTIHAIYAYWNRVARFINFNFEKPFGKRQIYFNQTLLDKLKSDFNGIEETSPFKYLVNVYSKLSSLDRNEFAHNNSLIMQEYLSNIYDESRVDFDEINKTLVFLNNKIARDIDVLCELLEYLENSTNHR
ncbi:MAG: hypothetical protein EOO99_02600 [Pedobacter sp.]|nr:MAG: hypothetical protein EOO99_02600 [Pedobacter sp.]